MDSGNLLQLNNLFHLTDDPGFDFIDKLNQHVTAAILIIIISMVFTVQIFGSSIQCYVPKEYTESWEKYVEHICWIKNTYHLPDDSPLSGINQQLNKPHKMVTYYQWVPVLLGIQIALAFFPRFIWFIGSNKISYLLTKSREAKLSKATKSGAPDLNKRDKSLDLIKKCIEDRIKMRKYRMEFGDISRWKKFLYRKFQLGYCRNTLIFISTRFMNIGVNLLQIFVMQKYLDSSSFMFGYKMLRNAFVGQNWKMSGNFPRVTMCHYWIRDFIHETPMKNSVQCELIINYFFEKAYAFLWFWFFFLTIITSIDILLWLNRFLLPTRRQNFIAGYIQSKGLLHSNDKKLINEFIDEYLGGIDGILLLKGISRAADNFTAANIVSEIWNEKITHQKYFNEINNEQNIA